MNYFDLIIIIPLLWGAIMGFRKGLILELASIAGLVLGIWGSMKFSNTVAAFLSGHMEASASLISLVAFLLTFIGIVILVYVLAKLLDKTLKMAAMGLLIRISGAIFGLLKYALILTVLLYVFEWLNQRWEFVESSKYEESIAYRSFNTIKGPIYSWLEELDLDASINEIKEIKSN